MGSDLLIPFLVIHRHTIDRAVWEEGWRNSADFVSRQNDSPYVTQDIFDNYIQTVLSRGSLVLFGGFKQKKGIVVLKRPRGSRAYQITKIVHALKLAVVSSNNRAAFRWADIVANLHIVTPVAWVQEGKLLEQIE
jgi:hypothetical protein